DRLFGRSLVVKLFSRYDALIINEVTSSYAYAYWQNRLWSVCCISYCTNFYIVPWDVFNDRNWKGTLFNGDYHLYISHRFIFPLFIIPRYVLFCHVCDWWWTHRYSFFIATTCKYSNVRCITGATWVW